MSSILFKLKKRSSNDSRLEVISMLQKKFETHAEQAYPNASDDLVHIFMLNVPDDKQDEVLKELHTMAAVKYAETAPIRKLF